MSYCMKIHSSWSRSSYRKNSSNSSTSIFYWISNCRRQNIWKWESKYCHNGDLWAFSTMAPCLPPQFQPFLTRIQFWGASEARSPKMSRLAFFFVIFSYTIRYDYTHWSIIGVHSKHRYNWNSWVFSWSWEFLWYHLGSWGYHLQW